MDKKIKGYFNDLSITIVVWAVATVSTAWQFSMERSLSILVLLMLIIIIARFYNNKKLK